MLPAMDTSDDLSGPLSGPVCFLLPRRDVAYLRETSARSGIPAAEIARRLLDAVLHGTPGYHPDELHAPTLEPVPRKGPDAAISWVVTMARGHNAAVSRCAHHLGVSRAELLRRVIEHSRSLFNAGCADPGLKRLDLPDD